MNQRTLHLTVGKNVFQKIMQGEKQEHNFYNTPTMQKRHKTHCRQKYDLVKFRNSYTKESIILALVGFQKVENEYFVYFY